MRETHVKRRYIRFESLEKSPSRSPPGGCPVRSIITVAAKAERNKSRTEVSGVKLVEGCSAYSMREKRFFFLGFVGSLIHLWGKGSERDMCCGCRGSRRLAWQLDGLATRKLPLHVSHLRLTCIKAIIDIFESMRKTGVYLCLSSVSLGAHF